MFGSPSPVAIASKTFSSSPPRKIEMIAGGASLAPSRWSWPMLATEARSRPWCLLTAWITAVQKNRKWMLSAGVSPGFEQVGAGVGPHRPVVVLAGAVDAGEGLLVQEADEAVAPGDAFQGLHQQLLVVGADVGVLEDRRDLVLRRRDLVVAGLDRDAELPHFQFRLHHEGEHALRDRAEVVVVELVPLRRLGAEQGAAGRDQVGALEEVLLVDQEVLLLGADRGEDALALLVAEQPQRLDRRARERVHRAQQRDLRVERLAGPGGERGRDAEQRPVRVLEDEGGAGRVPGGVAAGLEGGANAAGREGGGVGLALDQLLAGEAGQHPAFAGGLEEASRASPRSSRSAAGTCACSGSRRSPAPRPSSPRRPRRPGSGRAPRRPPGSPAASRRRRPGRRSRCTATSKTLAPKASFSGRVRSSAPRDSPLELHCAAVTFCWRIRVIAWSSLTWRRARCAERDRLPVPTLPMKSQKSLMGVAQAALCTAVQGCLAGLSLMSARVGNG